MKRPPMFARAIGALIFAGLLPGICPIARANNPLRWNTGRLFIVPGRIPGSLEVIGRFQDGATVSFENLIAEEGSCKPSLLHNSHETECICWIISMPLSPPRPSESASQAASPPDKKGRRLFHSSRSSGPLQGVKLAFHPDASLIAWFLEPYSDITLDAGAHSNRSQGNFGVAYSIVSVVPRAGNERHFELRVNDALPFVYSEPKIGGVATETAFEWNVESRSGAIYAYSAPTNEVLGLRIHKSDQIEPPVLGTASRYVLPSNSPEPHRQLLFNPASYSLTLKTGPSTAFSFGRSKEEPEGIQKIADPFRAKRSEYLQLLDDFRIHWLLGAGAIREHVRSKSSDSPLPPPIHIGMDIEKWLKTAEVRAQKKTRGEDEPFNSMHENLLIELSPDLQASFPDLSHQLVEQLLASFEKTSEGDPDSEAFYIAAGNPGSFQDTVAAILNELKTKHRGSKTNALLIFDFSSGAPTKELSAALNALKREAQSLTKRTGRRLQFHFAVIAMIDDQENPLRQDHLKGLGSALPFELCLDRLLNPKAFLATLTSALERREVFLSPTALTGMTQHIRSHLPLWGSSYVNISVLADEISYILENAKLDLSSENLGLDVAQVYVQLRGAQFIGFDRHSIERIHRLYDDLSVNGSHPLNQPLIGLDREIERIQLVLREKQSQQRLPFIPFLLFGPTGTGKTLLASSLAESLGASKASVNIGTIGNPKSGSSLALNTINEAIRQLRVSTTGLKMLILEEIDKTPSILPFLMAALDPEQKGEKPLNFDGLIVVMTANMRKESQSYRKLIRLAQTDNGNNDDDVGEKTGSYSDLEFEVAVDALSGGNPDEKQTAEAMLGRLFKGLIFIPPINDAPLHRKEKAVSFLVKAAEKEYNIQLLVSDSAKNRLRRTLEENSKGNYRTALEAVRDSLRLAVDGYKEEHPELAKLTGHFALTEEKTLRGETIMKLEPIDAANPDLIIALLSKQLADYNHSLIASTEEAAKIIKNELQRLGAANAGLAFHYSKLRRFADALRELSKRPLTASPGSPEVFQWLQALPFPAGASPKTISKLRPIFEQTFHPLFESIAFPLKCPLPPTRRKISSWAFMLIQTLENIREKDPEGFKRWAQTALESLTHLGKNALHLDLAAAYSTSVLAAILADNMGRQYAREQMLIALSKNGSKKTQSVKEDKPLQAFSEECEELLAGFRAEAKKADLH